ncbi:peptidyl-prolyl isomerase [Auriculariales sp. MPI-PUGE-AT-0066]|nr:peptidyl-prolyl isomerase [Auriculariales sp. MPI-PUGE-AT-0066]
MARSGLLSGVTVETLTPATARPTPNTVNIHYVGTLIDGTKFDSSRDRGSPFMTQIGVGKVIKGWDEGVPQLSVGQKAILTCTPDFAYGARGFPPVIPPNSTLKFEVELMSIQK